MRHQLRVGVDGIIERQVPSVLYWVYLRLLLTEESVKAQLILADAATTHPDGTFSLLRGGISLVNIPRNAPIAYRGALTARIVAGPSEQGAHTFRIICADPDGGLVGQAMTGDFTIPPEGGVGCFVVQIQLIFPRFTKYQFSLSVDSHELDTWPFEAKEIFPTQAR